MLLKTTSVARDPFLSPVLHGSIRVPLPLHDFPPSSKRSVYLSAKTDFLKPKSKDTTETIGSHGHLRQRALHPTKGDKWASSACVRVNMTHGPCLHPEEHLQACRLREPSVEDCPRRESCWAAGWYRSRAPLSHPEEPAYDIGTLPPFHRGQ